MQITVSLLRRLINQYDKGEISISRFAEILSTTVGEAAFKITINKKAMKWINAKDVLKENFPNYKIWRVVPPDGEPHSIDSSDFWFADSQTIYFRNSFPRKRDCIEFLDDSEEEPGRENVF